MHRLLLLVHVDLEADDVAVLDLAMREREFWLHELDHSRFDFLYYYVSEQRMD